MKRSVAFISLTVFIAAGCANMSKEQQAAMGAGIGALVGGGIGALAGGGKGAAIGAASGLALGGVLGYALASDPYTQSVTRQANDWQQQTGAKPEAAKTSQVVENGQKREQIDVQNMVLADNQMLSGGHLSTTVKKQLKTAKLESEKVGGDVHVTCPDNATPAIMDDIAATGVSYHQDSNMSKGYIITLSRNTQSY